MGFSCFKTNPLAVGMRGALTKSDGESVGSGLWLAVVEVLSDEEIKYVFLVM